MRCLSCSTDGYYNPGACKKCFEESNKTKEELKRNIEELKSKVNFLKLLSPMDPTIRVNPHAPFSTPDVILVPYEDSLAEPIHAHKFVLVSRSPVFKAMLQNDMEESQSVTIKIPDISYDALRAFVNFLYTSEACLDEQMAFDLFVFAEKYQVKHLKAYCEKFLIAALNEDKAIANYAFAKQHNAQQLLDSTLACITNNINRFIRSEDYVNLLNTNPRTVVEIFIACLAREINNALIQTLRR